jgi:hypothetical protein
VPALPKPRRRVNPALRAVVRSTGKPGWLLTLAAGLKQQSKFSLLINAGDIVDTPDNIRCLERIADVVGFDRAELFLDGGE